MAYGALRSRMPRERVVPTGDVKKEWGRQRSPPLFRPEEQVLSQEPYVVRKVDFMYSTMALASSGLTGCAGMRF